MIGLSTNAAFNAMQTKNAMTNLTKNAQDVNPKALLQNEKKLMTNGIKNQLEYKAADIIENTQKKLKDENIKRTFDVIA